MREQQHKACGTRKPAKLPSGKKFKGPSPCTGIPIGYEARDVRQEGPTHCVNKLIPTPEQRPNLLSSWDWGEANVVYLQNAQSSSSIAPEYTADKVLTRQKRMLSDDADQTYNFHAGPDDKPWPSSCAWTKADKPSFWSADFTNGK